MHLEMTHYGEVDEVNYFTMNLVGIFGSSNHVHLKLIKVKLKRESKIIVGVHKGDLVDR